MVLPSLVAVYSNHKRDGYRWPFPCWIIIADDKFCNGEEPMCVVEFSIGGGVAREEVRGPAFGIRELRDGVE